MIKVQRYLTPGFLTHEADRHDDPPWGFRGGTTGKGGRLIKVQHRGAGSDVEDLPAKIHGLRNQTGDCIGFLGPCGGGYGDPLERPAEQVREDVLDDFCTRDHAYQAYGVVLTEALELDAVATQSRRAEMARQVA